MTLDETCRLCLQELTTFPDIITDEKNLRVTHRETEQSIRLTSERFNLFSFYLERKTDTIPFESVMYHMYPSQRRTPSRLSNVAKVQHSYLRREIGKLDLRLYTRRGYGVMLQPSQADPEPLSNPHCLACDASIPESMRLKYRPIQGVLFGEGSMYRLSPFQNEILQAVVMYPEALIPRKQLKKVLNETFARTEFSDDSLAITMSHLRKTLQGSSLQLFTIQGKGTGLDGKEKLTISS